MNLQQQILELVGVHKCINDEVKRLEEQAGLLLIGYKNEKDFIWTREHELMNSGAEYFAEHLNKLAFDKNENLWYIGNEEDFPKDSELALKRALAELDALKKELDKYDHLGILDLISDEPI